MKKFNVVRQSVINEVVEVLANDEEAAIQLVDEGDGITTDRWTLDGPYTISVKEVKDA